MHQCTINSRRINFTTESLDSLTKNPFKLPRPHGTPQANELGEGRKEPGITFTASVEYLYQFCLDHLTKQFLNTMETTHRTRSLTIPIEAMRCDGGVVSKMMRVHYWDIQCALVYSPADFESGGLTYEDATLLFNDAGNISEYFVLEISSANLRVQKPEQYQEKAFPKGFSKQSIERNGNRSK